MRRLKYDEVSSALFSEFPDFTVDESSRDLPYIVAGEFTRFVLAAYGRNDRETYHRGLHFLERLHLSDVPETRQLAAIGFLESIQNTWPPALLESNIPFKDLGGQSQKWWNKLNAYWNGDKTALQE